MTVCVRALLVCVLLALPSSARADWLLSLYTGAAATASNSLDITPAAGPAVSVPDVEYEGRSWKSPIYYGYRVGWTQARGHLGFEGEFTHAKSIATRLASADLTAFQLSHGLNFVLGNVVYRSTPLCSGHCILVARAGAGLTVPHVEGTFRGGDTSEYQVAGFGAQAGVGVELRLWKQVYAVADARLTHARVRVDLLDAKLSGPFTSRHADVGIAWRSR